jgi:uncharacterized membrane protein
VGIALKGYPLVFLPAYGVFLIDRRGIGTALKALLLAIAPFALGLLGSLLFAGWDGMLEPFKFHAARTLNGQSSYDALNYLIGVRLVPAGAEIGRIAPLLQISCALGAAALRPRSFEQLVHALLFATLGFMTFSVFYSPQFVLWILPIACFSRSWLILAATAALCWLTYLYFPVSFDLAYLGRGRLFLNGMVALVGIVRVVLMVLAAAPLCRRGR